MRALGDIELRSNDEAFPNKLAAQCIPDPTPAEILRDTSIAMHEAEHKVPRVESRSGAVEVGSALTVSDPFGCRCLNI
jgi:hypothetical protein